MLLEEIQDSGLWGSKAEYTFSGTAGQKVSVDISGSTFPTDAGCPGSSIRRTSSSPFSCTGNRTGTIVAGLDDVGMLVVHASSQRADESQYWMMLHYGVGPVDSSRSALARCTAEARSLAWSLV
jgi:hypothetical protein